MKNTIFFVMMTLALFASEETNTTVEESNLRIVPLLTSSPLLGAGLGAEASYLYDTGRGESSKSQLRVGGQYSNTDSYNMFVKNSAFFYHNAMISTTLGTFSHVNNDFQEEGKSIQYNTRTLFLSTLLMYELKDDFYLGGYVSYKKLEYNALNTDGADFLLSNGIVGEKSAGLGVAVSYDTRKSKYYPRDALWLSLRVNANPQSLGAENNYYSTIVDARYYAKGLRSEDVWAWQFYGQYSSEKTPDTGLPTLSGKSLLRGFPSGQFKARYLSGVQTEYRYKITHTKYKLVAFYGVASLNGGSYGTNGNSREDDGIYSSGGIGLRYAIQAKTGVDLRLDLVATSENQQALYLMFNQSF